MDYHYKKLFATSALLGGLAISLSLMLPVNANAASVALASSPLVSSTTASVQPNVMFILDDSGSMSWDYLPDWAVYQDPNTNVSYTVTPETFRNSGFNGVAYNPAITYEPPTFYKADGSLDTTTYPSQIGMTTATGADSSTKPNWKQVKDDGFGVMFKDPITKVTTTTWLDGNASYYVYVPGEYCTNDNLTNCVVANAPTTVGAVSYSIPATLRWCDSAALTNCKNINNNTFYFPRYPGLIKPATATISVSAFANSKAGRTSVTSIVVNGNQILFGTTGTQNNNANLAAEIAANINKCSLAATGACTIAGYRAGVVGSVVTIVAPTALGNVNYPVVGTVGAGSGKLTTTAFAGFAAALPGKNLYTNIVSGSTYPYPGTTQHAATRTDCAGTVCTYTEEMTNYANWWAYYHTRMQSMKSSVSRSFETLDNKYRVGFTTISNPNAVDGSQFLGNTTFETNFKNNWYKTLFAQNPTTSTPLRGALSKAGRYYANKVPNQVDPVQYSCQQNFTILSTDGYWNTPIESPSNDVCVNSSNAASNYGPFGLDNKTCVGNLDGNIAATKTTPAISTDRPKYEGPTATSSTLADVAKYYADTDLRSSALGNCSGAKSSAFSSGNSDVCTDNVFVSKSDINQKQHMTTFTMGLGADGTITYNKDYANILKDDLASLPNKIYPAPKTGYDFYNLLNGYASVNWSDPIANWAGERIDDLWHAAINGNGSYFSAKDPNQIIDGFNKALRSIDAKLGSAAGAATSTLNPVAGNNFAFVASYTSVKWTGNIEARPIDTSTGVTSETATWCAESIPAQTCKSGSVVKDTSGNSTIFNCVVANSSASACTSPSVFNTTTLECKTEIQNSCSGTLPAMIGPSSVSTSPCYNNANCDTRTIYTAPVSGLTALTGQNLVPFDSAYASANSSYFSTSYISGLNQWGTFSTTQQSAASANLVNYLRGQTGFEDRTANAVNDRLFRTREAVLGDALESQPTFLSKPVFSYPYPGYAAYKSAQANRAGTIFLGANDGMMHAFATSDMKERWAYVPSMVVPNMWKLASTTYDINHTNFVNGSPTVSDICIGTAAECASTSTAVWKTILVGGLNAGGRGYYALDVTDPVKPILLWELTQGSGTGKDVDMGFSYGKPIITRKADGTWVVLVTSGYNNNIGSHAGVGKGYLYVLNAYKGTTISKISTGVGDATTPSGLAKVTGWNNDPAGNAVGFVYGGDLLGNLWRFDINSASAATQVGSSGNGEVIKIAVLKDGANTPKTQPITTAPALGLVSGKRVVFVATGKYLEATDLIDTQQQTQYAISDDGSATLDNPAGSSRNSNTLIQQTITQTSGSAQRTVDSTKPVDFNTKRGWYVDFPAPLISGGASERVNVDSQLLLGTLIVPTIVPSNTVCAPGGSGWLNFFDYKTGGAISGTIVSSAYNSAIVGFNVIYINGKPKISVVTSTNPTPELDDKVPFANTGANFTGKRTLWRELIQ